MEWPYEELLSYNGKDTTEILESTRNMNILLKDEVNTKDIDTSVVPPLSYFQDLLVQKESQVIVLQLKLQIQQEECRKLMNIITFHGLQDDLEKDGENFSKCHDVCLNAKLIENGIVDESSNLQIANLDDNYFQNIASSSSLQLQDLINNEICQISCHEFIGFSKQNLGEILDRISSAISNDSLYSSDSFNISRCNQVLKADDENRVNDNCQGCSRCGILIFQMSNALSLFHQKLLLLQSKKKHYKSCAKIFQNEIARLQVNEALFNESSRNQEKILCRLRKHLKDSCDEWKEQQMHWMNSLTQLSVANAKLIEEMNKMKYDCDKFSRLKRKYYLSEKKRKSLVWQKNYLLKKLQACERLDQALYKQFLLQLDPYPSSSLSTLSLCRSTIKRLRVATYVIIFLIRLSIRSRSGL